MDQTSVYAPIFKSSDQDDGTLMIYGKATGSDLDLDQQRCDPDWLQRAMPEWFKIGNIREQHDSKRAVGKATEHEVKADGHYIKAHIVDPVAIAKTKAGVFTGLSIGIMKPRLEKTADGEWIRDGLIGEVSLCDRPCLPTATFTMCKTAKPGMTVNASDFDEGRGLVKCEELILVEDAPEVAEKAVTVPSPLDMPGAKKPLAETDALAKATDVGNLEAPAPGMTCVRCAEPGHLWCAPEGFDKDFAVGLVNQVIDKGAGSLLAGAHAEAEASDIDNATQAISIISQLICSEAAELPGQPSEAMDIAILLDAVASLQCFIRREQSEQTDITPDVTVADEMNLAATPDLSKKSKYNAEQMAAMLSDGSAMANSNGAPSYPIKDAEDLENAIHAVGRGKSDHSAIRKHIMKRARALGLESKLPDNWNADGSTSDKSAAPDDQLTALAEKARELGYELAKTTLPDEAVEPVEVEKAVTPEAPVETEQVDTEKSTAPDLVKALTGALKDETSELRELFKSILHDDTTVKALESTQATLGDISARLDQVEKMATPGGPALRRKDTEAKAARGNDLIAEANRYKALAGATDDALLRRGFLTKASQAEAEYKALSTS